MSVWCFRTRAPKSRFKGLGWASGSGDMIVLQAFHEGLGFGLNLPAGSCLFAESLIVGKGP